MTKIIVVATLGAVLAGLSVALIGTAARADPPKPSGGIYWESAGTADGVRVRRMQDTTYGVVCYVALRTGPENTPHNSPTISCVR
jgi:hypothetical protein